MDSPINETQPNPSSTTPPIERPSATVILPREGKLLGIDFGTVRVGLATTDPNQEWVTPYDTYQRRNERLDGQFFQKLAKDERLVGIVLGLPIHCDGNESQKSNEVRHFALWLQQLTGLPIRFFDERFSTAEAKRLLQEAGIKAAKHKKTVDRLAAHLILSHYIESRGRTAALGALEDAPRRAP